MAKIAKSNVKSVVVKKGRGRNSRRWCVRLNLRKPNGRSFRRGKKAPIAFMGCFSKKTDANKRAAKYR